MLKGFEIAKSANSNLPMLEYLEKGALRGVYLGFPELHEFYTMSTPGVTDWTGYPQSGKTELLLELLLNTSRFYNWKHLLYVPDIGSKEETIALLLHKLTGKTFDKRYKSNLITENDVNSNIDWLLEHFIILYKTDEKSKLTPYEFWDFGLSLESEIKGGVQTMTIDSWKDMKHDRNLRDDQYLEDVLSYRNMIAEKYKKHIHTIIHPRGLSSEKKANGERKVPGPDHLKGGSEWWNNGKNIVSIHRPEGERSKVEIHIVKAKPKSVAKQGVCSLFYDWVKSNYYWIDNSNNKRFAQKEYVNPLGVSLEVEESNDEIPF